MLREIGFRYVTAFEDRKAPFYLSGGLTIMREITYESIVSAVRDLCIEANCALPCPDLKEAIAKAEQTEPSRWAAPFWAIWWKTTLSPARNGSPHLPGHRHGGGVLPAGAGRPHHRRPAPGRRKRGRLKGYTEGFLRKSVVRDPIRRVNTDDNTPAVLHGSWWRGISSPSPWP